MSKKREDRWIASAQVLVDKHVYSRAVLIHERENLFRLLGPVGCAADNDMELKDREGTESKMKRLIEKELRAAGYL